MELTHHYTDEDEEEMSAEPHGLMLGTMNKVAPKPMKTVGKIPQFHRPKSLKPRKKGGRKQTVAALLAAREQR